MGVIGGGSVTYPTDRVAFISMKELKILESYHYAICNI